jgi:hypothetical protein
MAEPGVTGRRIDRPGAGGDRVRPAWAEGRGRWAALAAVVGLSLAGSCTRGAQVQPSPSARSSATAAGCQLRVAESGFTNRHGLVYGRQVAPAQGEIQYGVIVENPCQQAAVDVQLVAQATDASGTPLPYDDGVGSAAEPRKLSVLLPGQRIGVAGELNNGRAAGGTAGSYDPTKVAAINVSFRHVGWQPVTAVPQQVTATSLDVVVGARGADGYAPVTFTLKLTPPRVPSDEWGCVIVRDAAGKIVSGDVRRLTLPPSPAAAGDIVHTRVWVPPSSSGLRAEIYSVPGGF